MAKSAYQKQQEANQKNDQLLAQYAAQGRTLNSKAPNPNKPNPVGQARTVRENLADRYKKVGEGKAIPIGSTKGGLMTPSAKGTVANTSRTSGQGSAPGVRPGIIASIADRPTTSYSNTASRVVTRPSTGTGTTDQSAARRAVGGLAATPTNARTIFQEGLRARLVKR